MNATTKTVHCDHCQKLGEWTMDPDDNRLCDKCQQIENDAQEDEDWS